MRYFVFDSVAEPPTAPLSFRPGVGSCLMPPLTRDVLITGATGTLGPKWCGEATAAGHHVRAMSRRSHVGYTGVHWAQADLLADAGIDAAVEGVDVIVHCATQGTGDKDVTSTREPLRRRAQGRRRPHHLRLDRRHRPNPAALLQDQAARRAGTGSLRRRPHGVARHPVPRPDQHDLLDPAVLPCAVRAARCAVPAHRHPRRRGAARRTHRHANRRAASPTSAAPPCTRTPSWPACTSRPAAAVDGSSQCPCRGASSPATESGANLVPDNPVGTIGFAEYLAETE